MGVMLETTADEAGALLRERLLVYRRYLPEEMAGEREGNEWVSATIQEAIEADDEAGQRYRARLN